MRCEGEKTYAQPGSCPVCNMKLVPVENKLVQAAPPNEQVLSRQATFKLRKANTGKSFAAQGYIVPAQNRNQSVAARFGGRLEKLYVKFNNQYVRKGEKVMEIYSPALANIQEEHLFLLKSDGESLLLQKSRERLRLLGVGDGQIADLEKNGRVVLTVPVYSPASGYVLFDTPAAAEATLASEKPSAMTDLSQQPMSDQKPNYPMEQKVQEGMYINAGQTIFSVNDLEEVWALVSIPGQFINEIRLNQSVELVAESNPSKRFKGKVALLEPTFEDANQRFSRVRIVMPNAENLLKINMLVKARIDISTNNNLQVPTSAVYKTGLNAYAWVKLGTTEKGTGIFQLRKVVTGESYNGMVTIESGLSPDEEIAKEAGLMTDSETFLSER